jgi:hypothetical protein
MTDEETFYEQNLGRLIRASCGPETRVTPFARHQLRDQLETESRARSAGAEFPAVVLGVLTGVLLLLVIGGVWTGWGRGSLPANRAVWSPFCVLVLLNLLCLPAAGLVIILRRRWSHV